jgi:hypothetical protein
MKAFGRFWWDFLIGDDPKIAVSVVVVLAAGAVAVAASSGRWAAVAVGGALVAGFAAAVLLDVRHKP